MFKVPCHHRQPTVIPCEYTQNIYHCSLILLTIIQAFVTDIYILIYVDAIEWSLNYEIIDNYSKHTCDYNQSKINFPPTGYS